MKTVAIPPYYHEDLGPEWGRQMGDLISKGARLTDINDYVLKTPVNERPWLVCEREMQARRHQFQQKEQRGGGSVKALLFACDECGTVRAWGAE